MAQTSNNFVLPKVSILEGISSIDLSKYDKVIYLDGKGKDYISSNILTKNRLLVLVGSERGWHSSEVEFFKKKGIKEVTISDTTLRVEFAVCSFLSQLDWLRNAYRYVY